MNQHPTRQPLGDLSQGLPSLRMALSWCQIGQRNRDVRLLEDVWVGDVSLSQVEHLLVE